MLNKILKLFTIVVLFLIFITLFRYLNKQPIITKNWEFVGYQYKWSDYYVSHEGFKSENDCIDYGDKWLKKQDAVEALYTCSSDCKPYTGDLKVCKNICEYNRKGLIQCRK